MSSYSLDFDGSNDYVTVANIGTLSSLTVEFWMYNTDSANGSRFAQMVGRGANGNGWDWSVYLVSLPTVNTLRWVGPGGTTIDTNVIPLNTWTHIAVTCNNVQTKIYINGAPIRTQSTTNAMTNQTANVMFGIDTSLTRPYRGRLSEIRIWNIIRSDSDISTNYNVPLLGNETGLIGYYKLNSTSGSTAVDTSSSARNGTLSNFTLSGTTSNWVVGSPPVGVAPTIGALAVIPTKTFGTDVSFSITDPSSNSSGAFTYSSSNTSVATLNSTNALSFDGVNDGVALTSYPSLNSTNQLTIEGWIYTTGYSKMIVMINSTANLEIDAQGRISLYAITVGTAGNYLIVSDSAITLNAWVYIAVVKNDNGYNKIYVNNGLVKNVVDTTSGVFVAATGFSLGANVQASASYSSIRMSEFRMWTVARTAQQLTDTYNIQIPSNSSGLAIYYKFNQGVADGTNTGLTTLTDSTSNNYHGTLQGFALSGTTSNWVTGITLRPLVFTIVGAGTSTITATQAADASYNAGSVSTTLTVNGILPTTGTFTLGPKSGVYILPDASFSLTAPTSNSSGAFTYTSDNSGVATVITTAPLVTLYSITNPANRTLSLTNFPILGAMPTWEMNIRFTTGATGSNTWRPLIGDMYNAVNAGRGWGVWVSSSNGIHFSWNNLTWDAPVSLALSTEYILKLTRTPTSLTVLLTTVSSGATQSATNTAMSNTTTYVMSVNGPVSIGGWANNGELFVGTIAYVNVTNPNSSVTTNTTSNLLARYDASVASGYTLSGSNVTQWNDLTGNGYHLIPNGTGPTTTSMNSVDALNFNSGYGLTRTSVPLSTSITVFMVARYSTAIATWGNFMHHGHRDTDWSLERNNATSSVQFQINNDNTFCQIAAANNTNYLWVGRITGNTRDFWMYSDTVVPVYVSSNTPAVTIATGNKTLYVGKSDNNEACNSSIGEILYYNASLSNADVSANILYLQNKWLYSRYGTTIINPYVSLVSNGTANITATQAAAGNYLTKSVSSLLTVYIPVTPTLGTFTVPSTKTYGDASFNISLRPTSDSSGAFTYSSSNTGVATIDVSGNWITIVGTGVVSFNATQASAGQFSSAVKTSNTLTVNGALPTFGTFTLGPKLGSYLLADASFSLTAPTSDSSGIFSYTSDNSAVALITAVAQRVSTNLLARYDASVASGYTLSGSNVTQWNDLTGNGYHLTPNGTGPTLTTIKSVPAFNFNSGYGLLRASVPVPTTITIFMTIKYSSLIVNDGNFMHHGSSNVLSLERYFNTSQIQFQTDSQHPAPTILTVANNTNYILIGRFNGTTRDFWAYSDTVAPAYISGASAALVAGNNTLYVGKSINSEACNSTIGEFLYYNASLSNADVSANLLYLQNKWFNGVTAIGSGVTLVANGTANITATQDACGNYISKSTSSLLTVGGNQVASTLASSTFSVATNKTLVDSSFAITTRPTSNSDGAIMYSSSNTNVATIDSSGNFINIIGTGDVSFNATQAATTQYLSSIKTSNNLTVSKATPVYQPISQVTKIIGTDVSFSLTAIMAGVSTSNGAYTFSSLGATSTTILSTDNMNNVTGGDFNGGQYQSNLKVAVGVDLVGWTESGTNHIVDIANTVGQTNTPNYVMMFWSTHTITQTTAVSDSNILNTIYTVNFKAGPAVYQNGTQATGGTASDGIIFDILRANNTVLATSTYLPGAWAGYPTLTASSFTYTGDGTGNIRVRIKPVSSSTGRFSGCVDDVVISSTATRYVNISGDVATILEYTPSALTIAASQAATTIYNSGSTTFNLLVAYGTPSYQVIPQVTKTFGVDASFSLSAIMAGVSTSNGSYTFSSAADAISISGDVATINAYTPSAVTVTASQNAGLNYNPGTTTFSLLISRRTPSLSSATFTIPSPKVYGDASFSVFTRPVSDSSGAITYTSSNTSVATIDASGNFITIVGPGDVSFNATQAETSLFNAATRTSNTLTVSKITISLAFVNPPTTKNVTDAAFTVTATGARPDAVTYSSSNTARATVNSSTGLVTLRGVGTVIITASQASTEFYNVSTATCSIVIASAGTTLQGQDISSNTSFASVDLSGASLVGTTVSGVSFSSANLSNVDFSGAVITGTNFSNANISGATNLPAFSAVQKLQLLKNINNAGVGAVQFNAPISGADISSLLETPNNEVAAATFTVKAPTAVDASANKIVTVSSEDIAGNKSVYIPINENETVKLNNIVYSFNGTNLLDASGNVVTFLVTQNTPFKIYAGSIVALNIQNTLNRITILGDGLYNILHEILQPKTV